MTDKVSFAFKVRTTDWHWQIVPGAWDCEERGGYLFIRSENGGTLAAFAPASWLFCVWEEHSELMPASPQVEGT